MKFTINRKKWLRGIGAFSYLRRSADGKMCCVGQVCRQLGVPSVRLTGEFAVRDLLYEHGYDDRLTPLTRKSEGAAVERKWVKKAYEINDDDCIGDAERERKLTALANRNGHTFVFVG